MAKDMQKIFQNLVSSMASFDEQDDFLEACMSLDQKKIRDVPLRYRIIALGFARRLSLEEVNEALGAHNCPRLYPRSFWEATLIFAFLHRISYDEWLGIQDACRDLYALSDSRKWFTGGRITFGELEAYVKEASDFSQRNLRTATLTAALQSSIERLGDSVSDLRFFLEENIHSFSEVREKTRYYFCKYLYFYIQERIERYFHACQTRHGINEALEDLLCLKVVTVLRRNLTMPDAEKHRKILDSSVSCGEIFSAFSYFFFDFVTLDWVEELMDCYGSPENIPVRHRQKLADVFRSRYPELRPLSDDAVLVRALEAQEEQMDTGNIRHSRSGELSVYAYIQGKKDIDRLTLMCFLLFFASNANLDKNMELTPERLNSILSRCGYSILDPENDADWFVLEFLESDNGREFLQDVLDGYAQHHENSFLYRLYGNSIQYSDELARILLGPHKDKGAIKPD